MVYYRWPWTRRKSLSRVRACRAPTPFSNTCSRSCRTASKSCTSLTPKPQQQQQRTTLVHAVRRRALAVPDDDDMPRLRISARAGTSAAARTVDRGNRGSDRTGQDRQEKTFENVRRELSKTTAGYRYRRLRALCVFADTTLTTTAYKLTRSRAAAAALLRSSNLRLPNRLTFGRGRPYERVRVCKKKIKLNIHTHE